MQSSIHGVQKTHTFSALYLPEQRAADLYKNYQGCRGYGYHG